MHTTKINIIQQNLRKSSLAKEELLNSISNSLPDILMIQEPNLFKNNFTFSLSSKSYHKICDEKIYTATIVFNNSLNTSLIDEFSNTFATTIKINSKKSTIILVNIYLLPNSFNDSHNEFFASLFLTYSNTPIITSGDFNARDPLWHDRLTNFNGRFIKNVVDDHDLIVHNNHQKTCRNASIIDLTITNFDAFYFIKNWSVRHLTETSDHDTICFDIQLSNDNFNICTNFSTFKFSENALDYTKFLDNFDHELLNEINESLLRLPSIRTIDDIVDKLTCLLISAASKTFKTKKTKNLPSRPSWWSKSLLAQRKYFNYIKNLFYRNDPRIDIDSYRAIRNHYKASIRKAKRRSFHDFLEDCQSNNTFGNTFKLIKRILSPRSTNIPLIDSRPDKLNSMNDILDSLFPNDDSTTDNSLSNQVRNYIPILSNDNSIIIENDEIDSIIDSLSDKKAPGPDFITNKMIKCAKNLISPILTKLFNNCFILNYYPRQWKTSIVKIIPKLGKDDYLNVKNYRPISLISNLSKIFEKTIQKQLYRLISDHLHPSQHGFIKNKSTITALSKIVNTAIQHKKTQKVAIVTIDIQQAFDRAWKCAIIKELDKCNIPSCLILLISSYLSGRSSDFIYSDIKVKKDITMGCPQGGALSPLLWNILLNNLLSSIDIQNTSITAFADDISIVCWANNIPSLISTIKESIVTISDWCKSVKLSLNDKKTNILYLFKSHKPRIFINDNIISPADSLKILGVSFKNHRNKDKLDFSPHIKNTCLKMSRITNILFKFIANTWGINYKKRINLYKGMLRPIILYGHQIWEPHINKKQWQKLNSIQHNILRKATFSYKTVSIYCVCSITGVPKISDYCSIMKSTPHTHDRKILLSDKINELIKSYISQCNDTFKAFFDDFIPKFFIPNFYNMQFLTNHGNFNFYLHKIKKTDNPLCDCYLDEQTSIHLLTSCPNFHCHFSNIKDYFYNKTNFSVFNQICNSYLCKKSHFYY